MCFHQIKFQNLLLIVIIISNSKFQQVNFHHDIIIKNWCVHENLNSASTCKWSDISGTSDPIITIMQNKVFLSTYSTSLYCGLILEVYAIDYKYGF